MTDLPTREEYMASARARLQKGETVRDRLNFPHDMIEGPCACGAWHHGWEELEGLLAR